MRIEGLRKYRGRNPNGYFTDLPPTVRLAARQWLNRLLQRRRQDGKQTPPWMRAILIGQAKRLAVNPPSSAWGRSMLAKRGGYAVQRQYRAQGLQPTAAATRRRVLRLRQAKAAEQAATGTQRQPRVFFDIPLA